MEILKRVSKDGAIVGVELDMDGYICPFPMKALYSEQILVALIDNGYKFYDYHGDIELPGGIGINELITQDLSEYNPDEVDGFNGMLVTAEMEALTDTEASQYYSYRSNMEKIELPHPGSYEINTRVEFEQYIAKQQVLIASVGYSNDNRPINSFVSPDALYTMEEVTTDPSGAIRAKLNILAQRRKFKDFTAYEKVVEFLMNKGVLTSKHPTAGEFVRAYHTWGPDGIVGDLINLKFKQGVDGAFKTPDDDMPSSADKLNHVCANRRKVPFVLDTDANMRHLTSTTSLNGVLSVEEFGRKSLAITLDSVFVPTKRRDNKGYKYSLGYAQESVVTDRVYFTYVVNGFKYIYKVDVNGAAMFIASRTSPVWISSVGFSVASTLGNIDIPLDEVHGLDNYLLWNICLNEAAIHVKERRVEAPVASTYELLMSVGMTPISAIRYIACHVLDQTNYGSNQRIRDMYEGLSLTCVDKFYQEIPDEIYDAFMLDAEDVSGMRDFIDMADIDGLLDRRDLMILGELTPSMPGYDKTFETDKERRAIKGTDGDAVYYYNNIKFVIDCIDGLVSIDAFGDGISKDQGGGTKIAADVLMSIIYGELGENPDLGRASQILSSLTTARYLDIATLFRTRDNAYKGFLIDYSRARKCKANVDNTWAWAYVSKVFRELGNKPIEETRPYLLELIMLQNDKKGMIFRKALVDSVKDAMEKSGLFSNERIFDDSYNPDYGMTYYDAALNMVDDVASKLFFTILGKKGYTQEGDDYVYDIKFDMENSIRVHIPSKVAAVCQNVVNDRANHVRYITVFDACEREFSHYAKGGAFALHIINADLTPWSIAPRKGFKINTFSLLPSYYRQQALVDKFGEQWYSSASNARAISSVPLIDMLPRLEVPTFTDEEQYCINQDLRTMNSYNDFDQCMAVSGIEQVSYYVKRWSEACKLAKAQNMIVEHMPLKQDIAYQYLAEILAGTDIQDELRFKQGQNTALSGTETSVIKHGNVNLLAIETHTGSLSLTKMTPGDITTEQFADIYINLIAKGKMVVISGKWVLGLGEDVCIPLANPSHPTIQKLFREHAVTYGNDYYIVSINGIYKIGVKA